MSPSGEGYDLHQAEDNRVHLAFYVKEREVSFVWNGSQGNYVDVCEDGYAEPMVDRFELPWTPGRLSLQAVFPAFEEECKLYLRANPNIGRQPIAETTT